jgi:hypothetical protein
MKIKLLVISFLITFASSLGATEQQRALPSEFPYKKSLTMASVLLATDPQENTQLVKKLSEMMSKSAILESEILLVKNPLRKARKDLKVIAGSISFKDEQDLEHVIDHITKNNS